jgi:hypothetical protein
MLVSAAELALAVEPEPVLAALLELELLLLQPAATIAAMQPAAATRIALGLRPLTRRASLRTSICHSPLGIFELVNDEVLSAIVAAVQFTYLRVTKTLFRRSWQPSPEFVLSPSVLISRFCLVE